LQEEGIRAILLYIPQYINTLSFIAAVNVSVNSECVADEYIELIGISSAAGLHPAELIV